jgi:PadR family transcriptional regulator
MEKLFLQGSSFPASEPPGFLASCCVRLQTLPFLVDSRQENRILLSNVYKRNHMSPAPRSDLLQGTLDLLILKVLALGPQHGWGISQRILQISEDVLRINQGSLYPALHRLEEQGWIASSWGVSDNNREAKFYRLTRTGQRQLQRETDQWERISGAVGRVLRAES